MEQKIYIKGRDYFAEGRYIDGQVLVCKDSKIKSIDSIKFKMNEAAKIARNDTSVVLDDTVLKDYLFNSPSTAAQFVTGGSRDGYDTWKVEKCLSLGEYLEAKGIRARRKKMKA